MTTYRQSYALWSTRKAFSSVRIHDGKKSVLRGLCFIICYALLFFDFLVPEQQEKVTWTPVICINPSFPISVDQENHFAALAHMPTFGTSIHHHELCWLWHDDPFDMNPECYSISTAFLSLEFLAYCRVSIKVRYISVLLSLCWNEKGSLRPSHLQNKSVLGSSQRVKPSATFFFKKKRKLWVKKIHLLVQSSWSSASLYTMFIWMCKLGLLQLLSKSRAVSDGC